MISTSYYELEEIGFWISGNIKQVDDERVNSSSDIEENTATAIIKSCIFYNFYDQCRVGVDSTLIMEKCHMSECRSNSIHAINPKILKISNCTISKPSKNGLLVEWLRDSNNINKCRSIIIESNEIYGAGNLGLSIMS